MIESVKEEIKKGERINIDKTYQRIDRKLILLPILDDYRPTPPYLGGDSEKCDSLSELIRHLDKIKETLNQYIIKASQLRKKVATPLLLDIFEEVEDILSSLETTYLDKGLNRHQKVEDSSFPRLIDKVEEIEKCLGESSRQIERWSDLKRHLRYSEVHDLSDIIRSDWPEVKYSILRKFFQLKGTKSKLNVAIIDVNNLVVQEPSNSKLNLDDITPEEFERLIFQMVSSPNTTYENAELSMRINAPDRGRDIAVNRVFQDSFMGSIRFRLIIQCKHWPNKSISLGEITKLREQVKLWEPPKVDVLVIATTGYFSLDAVQYIDKHNQSADSSLKIELWAREKINQILVHHPHVVKNFRV